jgi:riboflavin synthase
MFTGIIDDVGTVDRVSSTEAGLELRVRCGYRDLRTGESVALNGACLTILEAGQDWFTVAAMTTTLERTTIASWRAGQHVNLERAMRLGDRLSGHLVQGHVDGLGEILRVRRHDTAVLVDIGVPPDIAPVLVSHGSLAVDGVSLTINALPEPGVAQVSLIEYTMRHTTLGTLSPGDRVHLEADVIGKYVARLIGPYSLPRG